MSEQCSKRVYAPMSGFRGRPCLKPATVQDADGHWWCHVHSPAAVAKRNMASQARYDHATDVRAAERAVAVRERAVIDMALAHHTTTGPLWHLTDAVHYLLQAKQALAELKKGAPK